MNMRTALESYRHRSSRSYFKFIIWVSI